MVASILAKVPISTPSSSGLELLAAAAAATTPLKLLPLLTLQLPSLSAAGPFNPAASLPPKVVKKILDLEFIERLEISMTHPKPQAAPQYRTYHNGWNNSP